MIPTTDECKALWDTYALSPQKRIHCQKVTDVADIFAKFYKTRHPGAKFDGSLVHAAALLHDIDKQAPQVPGERHPDGAVRILKEHHMEEVAAVVKTHPLHAILDPSICPTTFEEKILYLSDKMVKYDIIGVTARFSLWEQEHLDGEAQRILREAKPKVFLLEKEIVKETGISFPFIVQLIEEHKKSV